MHYRRIAVVLLSVVTLFLAACEQKSPQEQVAALRARYTATVNQSGFVARPVMAEPAADDMVSEDMVSDDMASDDMVSDDMASDDMASDATDPSDDDLLEPPDLGPARYDILLDIVVSTTSQKTLPALTVDIVHLDSSKQEKQRWQVTLDTSKVVRGPGAQITQELKEVDYVDGDFFFTEVRVPVPAAEIAKYPELANAV